jgi:hypothetical protein
VTQDVLSVDLVAEQVVTPPALPGFNVRMTLASRKLEDLGLMDDAVDP